MLSHLQVIKEVLRYRPPAPMVPQVAMKPFKLTDSYTVRVQGSMHQALPENTRHPAHRGGGVQ